MGTTSQKSSIKRWPPSSQRVIIIIFCISHTGSIYPPQLLPCCVLSCILWVPKGPFQYEGTSMQSTVSLRAVPASEGWDLLNGKRLLFITPFHVVICFQLLYTPFMWHKSSWLIPVTELHWALLSPPCLILWSKTEVSELERMYIIKRKMQTIHLKYY